MDNDSVVRIFTLSGINETINYRLALFTFTLLHYCIILFVNTSLILIIILNGNLHEPMYILLCSFYINALYGTAGFYPKFLSDLLSSSQQISYSGCLFQVFVVYSFACKNVSILAVMAYDRYLAICRPLHYQSLMSKRRLSQLISFSWLTPFCIVSITVILTSRLRLCGSHIQKLYCVNWVIVKLACPGTDTFSNSVAGYVAIFIYTSHWFFIVWTYIYLIKTCARSKEDRAKFMQTCMPHLFSLITDFIAFIFDLMFMRFGTTDLPQSLRNFISIEFLLIPPVISPLIYGWKLTKIRNRIMGLVHIKGKIAPP